MKNSQLMYLQKRSNGVFYFRRRIPAPLAGLVDARYFHCSLKTRNGREVANLYAIALKRSEAEIINATRTLHERPEGALQRLRRAEVLDYDSETGLYTVAPPYRHALQAIQQHGSFSLLTARRRYRSNQGGA